MSYDENPADNDPHGECRSEIHQLQSLLGQVYDQCGNHRAADRRHCLPPRLRDEIQGYLQAAGHRRAIAEQENKGGNMEQDNVDHIAKNRKKFEDVVWHVKNGVGLSFTADSALVQAVIWASKRIAELEAESPLPETGSDEVRVAFFCLGHRTEMSAEMTAISYCEAVAWGQDRLRHLERDKRDVQELLNQNSELSRENERLELENENLSRTVLMLSKSPQLASPDSDEEIYERRRRERMQDEITLICVRDRIEQLIDAGTEHFEPGATTETRWGRNSRDTADNICRGINEYDAAH